MKTYNTYEVKSLNDLNKLTGSLDEAQYKAIYYGEDKKIAENHVGIYNDRTETLAQIGSRNYAIIQHNDVLQALGETLKARNIDIMGRVDDFGDKVKFDLVFNNKGTPVRDGEKGIKLGIRVINSYDKSTSFRLEMFGFRMICQNGMSLGKALNNVKEICFHTGKNKNLAFIRQLTNKFIDTVIDSSDILQSYVNSSIEDSLLWKKVAKIVELLLDSKKHREKVLDLLNISTIEIEDTKTKKIKFQYILKKEGKQKITRWSLYNALTSYVTHNKIGFTTETNIQDKAQKILKTDFRELEKIQVPIVNGGN